jgi:AraC family transcriptional regulator
MPSLVPGQTFGEIANGLAAGATLSRHSPDHRLPLHEHEGAYACIVLSGSFRERDAGSETVHRAGDVIVHPAGERHADDFGRSGALCLNLRIDATLVVNPGGRRADPVTIRAADELAAEIAKGEHGDRLVAEALVAELAALAPACRAPVADCVARVLQALDDAPEEHWTLTALAQLAGRHPTHLARAFRARTGVSVGAYCRRRRLTRLALDLRMGCAPLSILALEHGYADQAHMSREFRAFAGVPPAIWRRLAR